MRTASSLKVADSKFKVWRVLEEQESADGRVRVITKKEYIGEIENPKHEIYLTWTELDLTFGEGYYLVEVPEGIHRHYLVPDKQLIRTPAYFDPSQFVCREGSRIAYGYAPAWPSQQAVLKKEKRI